MNGYYLPADVFSIILKHRYSIMKTEQHALSVKYYNRTRPRNKSGRTAQRAFLVKLNKGIIQYNIQHPVIYRQGELISLYRPFGWYVFNSIKYRRQWVGKRKSKPFYISDADQW